jgi:hypothetical protein
MIHGPFGPPRPMAEGGLALPKPADMRDARCGTAILTLYKV